MKTVIIPETTFTAAEQDSNGYTTFLAQKFIDYEQINVVFDGVEYVTQRRIITEGSENQYGATIDRGYDFSEYPFLLMTVGSTTIGSTRVIVEDNNEHTIEVYVEDGAPVVTKKYNNTQILQLDERLIIFDETTGDIVTFDGENWQLGSDNFGEAVMPSKYAVVGTAIVGKDIVGPSHTVGYAIVGTDEVGGI